MEQANFNIKVFRKGTIIYIIPQNTNVEIEGFSSGVNGERIVRLLNSSTEWMFLNFNSDTSIKKYSFPIENILKENGTAYTNEEFKLWVEENTGVNGSSILEQIAENTAILPQNTEPNIYQGSDPIVFPANTQSSLSISAVDDDLEVVVNGVTATLPSGTTINYTAKSLLSSEIEIISGSYLIVAIGDKITSPLQGLFSPEFSPEFG